MDLDKASAFSAQSLDCARRVEREGPGEEGKKDDVAVVSDGGPVLVAARARGVWEGSLEGFVCRVGGTGEVEVRGGRVLGGGDCWAMDVAMLFTVVVVVRLAFEFN